MSDMMQITIPQQMEITEAVADSMGTLESILQTMPAQEQAVYMRDSIRSLVALNIRVSQAALMHMWIVFSRQLWVEKLENGVRYDTFRDWVDEQIAPTFNKQGDDRPPAEIWLQDVVRVVERTLPYAMRHPVKTPKGELITPDYLIKEIGLGKLKITSSKFTDDSPLTIDERNQLLVDIATLPSSKLRLKYTTTRIPAIHAAINIMPTGNADILLMGLTDQQVGLLRSSLGDHNLKEYQVHFSEPNRAALLGLLPIDAQKQVEVEIDNQQNVA